MKKGARPDLLRMRRIDRRGLTKINDKSCFFVAIKKHAQDSVMINQWNNTLGNIRIINKMRHGSPLKISLISLIKWCTGSLA